MYNPLKPFNEQTELLYDTQYGFQEKPSTKNAILHIVNTAQGISKTKMFSIGIFVDLEEAFDTVDHPILHKPINYYGIGGIAHNYCILSHLPNHTQATELDRHNLSRVRRIHFLGFHTNL